MTFQTNQIRNQRLFSQASQGDRERDLPLLKSAAELALTADIGALILMRRYEELSSLSLEVTSLSKLFSSQVQLRFRQASRRTILGV